MASTKFILALVEEFPGSNYDELGEHALRRDGTPLKGQLNKRLGRIAKEHHLVVKKVNNRKAYWPPKQARRKPGPKPVLIKKRRTVEVAREQVINWAAITWPEYQVQSSPLGLHQYIKLGGNKYRVMVCPNKKRGPLGLFSLNMDDIDRLEKRWQDREVEVGFLNWDEYLGSMPLSVLLKELKTKPLRVGNHEEDDFKQVSVSFVKRTAK